MAALLLAASCTNTDYIDVDNVDPILVVNGQISTANTTHTIVLSSSSLSSVKEVNGANLTVSVNGGAPIKAVEDNTEEEQYGYGLMNGTKYRFNYNFAAGDNVKLNVADANGAVAEATVNVPKDPIIKKVEVLHEVPHTSSDSMFDFGGGYDYYGPYTYEAYNSQYPYDSWHELRITLQDIPSEDSYYRLDVVIESTITDGEDVQTGYNGIWMDTSSEPVLSSATSSSGGLLDAIAEESNRYNAFSDNIFKDQEYTLKLFFQESQVSYLRNYYYSYDDTEWTYNEDTGAYEPSPLPDGVTYETKMHVRLYSISHDQYIYLKALDLDDLAIFFSEPISIPSNVNGGMGFVTIDSCKEYTLDY